MYSVVEIAGHQYMVRAGDLIDVEKLKAEEGKNVEFSKVLFVGGGKGTVVGLPTVPGAKVVAKVIRHDRGEKILMMKRKPGKYRKSKGHRQHYTALLVTEVADGKGNSEKIDSNSKNAKKYLK